MTYKEWKKQEETQANSLPIFWAFSNQQLSEELSKRGLDINNPEDLKQIVRVGAGGFCLRSDRQTIIDFFNKDSGKELHGYIENDPKFAREAFLYEMRNHEYPINHQADWEVVSCFGKVKFNDYAEGEDYLKELGFSEAVQQIYKECRKQVYNEFDY